MLTLARNSRRLFQKELSDKLGISQGQLSKIEDGLASVDLELLNHISEVLNYPKEFFAQEDEIYPSGIGFDRNKKSLSAKKRRYINAISNIYRIHLKKMLNRFELDVENIPRLEELDSGFAPSDAEIVAEAVRQYYNLPKGPIKNLTDIIENSGIFIIEADFKTDKQDGFTIDAPDSPPIIFVNSNLPPDRYRFTLAHEFGHLILHKFPTADSEKQADTFASSFLFPQIEAKDELSLFKGKKSIDLKVMQRLKYKYGISLQTVLYAGMKLGYFTDNDRKYFYVQLSRAGFSSKNEPFCGLEKEKPTLLKNLINLHLNKLEYSLAELCEVLILFTSDFYNKYSVEKTKSKLSLVK